MLKDQIKKDIIVAARGGDTKARSVLRSLISEINNKEIEEGKKEEGLSDQDIGKIVIKEMKKRSEAREQYEAAGRDDLAREEKQELEILSRYTPQLLTEEEVDRIIDKKILELGAESEKEMGVVIKEVMKEVAGEADGSVVSRRVKEKLAG